MPVPVAILQAGEIGKQLPFTQNALNAPNFATGSVNLLVTPIGGTLSTYGCSIVGNQPVYTTLGNEFPTPGKYQIQLEYVASGEKYYSAVQTVLVLANLG